MFEPQDSPRLFGMPPGTDFPRAVVRGIVERMDGAAAEATARVTLYVNSARMLRSVRTAFDAHGARFLPRLRLVTDLGRDPMAGLPAAVPPLRRRLQLSRLIKRLVVHEPDIAADTTIYDLADSLARLIDEMHGEGVSPDAFEASEVAENHAAHWERSLAFLRIVAPYFGLDAPPDVEARQRQVIESLARRWTDEPVTDPVIVAGSTGSRGATAAFMRAVANLPQGAVVLPGVDFEMPQRAWDSLSSGPIPGEDHPQYRFLHLTRRMGTTPDSIRIWSDDTAPDPARNRLISLALRPAPVTDQWIEDGAALGALTPMVQGLTLIEAGSPREEAQAIAVCLRDAAETGCTAALITPDRMLTRRVAAALDRWGIVPDDSAGEPLSQSAPGRFLRHTAELLGARLSTEALLVLLKHPLTSTGADTRGDHLRFTRDLELRLRRYGPAFPTPGDLMVWAKAHGEGERITWAEWLGQVFWAVEGVGERPLPEIAETHLTLCEDLAAGPGGQRSASKLWRKEAGRAARAKMEEIRREASHGGTFRPHEYADLVGALLRDGSVRRTERTHPNIMIWGRLEARVQGADLVILAGLNDGVWPENPAPDPWLSRQMRLKAGLLLPERRVGLSAHDFQQAAGARRVILSRAIRDAEAQTVPSRWLVRLTNLLNGLPVSGGTEALALMRARGKAWLEIGRAVDLPCREHRAKKAPRPAPRPPIEARPTALPVTAIQQLIRDPYAVYAERILRLRPLDPLRAAPDARLRGKVLHEIVESFIRDRPASEGLAEARARLLALAQAKLAEDIPWPSAQRLWLSRLSRIADTFLTSELARQELGVPFLLEEKGSISLENLVFTLIAKPDRIDLLNDGRVHIFDYKTGAPPSDKKQRVFDKQLLLEAAMAERGAFAELGPREVAGTTYIHLGGDGGERPGIEGDGLVEQTWVELHRLIGRYGQPQTGYISRRAVFEIRHRGDYDHLARFGEWMAGDKSEPEDVG
ncbi:hypothetical protein DEA8626_02583 [Defluviimonas aquaemixtae]|uniref:PD-(D/E)XK endonuclease-like domain-containing protein n=1 Tax=Albidovulum aquaemixtae TaxID=1542388 RepID=A0A2R8BJR2_9RHOB|nr:double-strand break repair protein AddB [Defluviimonas aquaemixtae]SPH23519.1 hypothetical protein DEA8626_02583 [Defluviimonas aquaemixtae]